MGTFLRKMYGPVNDRSVPKVRTEGIYTRLQTLKEKGFSSWDVRKQKHA
jgi:hypothetical protein